MSAQLALPLVRCCRIELPASRTSWRDADGRVQIVVGYPRGLDGYWRIFMESPA
jgi:hypothetical protein